MSSLDQIFGALSDPTRRAILARLMHGEATVDELAKPFDMSQPSISRHLKVLEDAGLVTSRIEGTSRPRRIEPAAFDTISEWLDQYRDVWKANYARLDGILDELRAKDAEK